MHATFVDLEHVAEAILKELSLLAVVLVLNRQKELFLLTHTQGVSYR